jgi:hypothetical protein
MPVLENGSFGGVVFWYLAEIPMVLMKKLVCRPAAKRARPGTMFGQE